MQNSTATMEDSLALSCKTKHTLTINSSNCALQYSSKRTEDICPHKNLHVDVLAALFITVNTKNQPRYSSMGKLINWYIQIIDYYSVLKRSYQAMKKYKGNINVCYSVKEANLKVQYTLQFQLHGFWKRQNYEGFFFNWPTVGIHVNFWCTAKWFNYTYTFFYILFH